MGIPELIILLVVAGAIAFAAAGKRGARASSSAFDPVSEAQATYSDAIAVHEFDVFRFSAFGNPHLLVVTPRMLHFRGVTHFWNNKPKMFNHDNWSYELRDILHASSATVQDNYDTWRLDAGVLHASGKNEFLRTPSISEGRKFIETLTRQVAIARGITASATEVEVGEQLTLLSELRTQGSLSESEWTRAKELFLGKPPDKKQQAIVLLRQLHSLREAASPSTFLSSW